MIHFLLVGGFIIGIVSMLTLYDILNYLQQFRNSTLLLKEIINAPIRDFNFSHRISHVVFINYKKINIRIDLNTDIIDIIIDQDKVASLTEYNAYEYKALFKRISYMFYSEIFKDVHEVNNITYSNNIVQNKDISDSLINEKKSNIPKFNLDDILDKISNNGMLSLSEDEKNYLSGLSE